MLLDDGADGLAEGRIARVIAIGRPFDRDDPGVGHIVGEMLERVELVDLIRQNA